MDIAPLPYFRRRGVCWRRDRLLPTRPQVPCRRNCCAARHWNAASSQAWGRLSSGEYLYRCHDLAPSLDRSSITYSMPPWCKDLANTPCVLRPRRLHILLKMVQTLLSTVFSSLLALVRRSSDVQSSAFPAQCTLTLHSRF